MKTTTRRILEIIGLCGIILILLSCSLLNLGKGSTTTVEPTQPLEPTATTDPTSVCPAVTEGTTAYGNLEHGFCLLFPSDFTLGSDSQRPDEVVTFTGPILPPPPKSMDSIAPYLYLEFNGAADGLDSAAYSDKWQLLFNTETHLPQQQATIGGQPAVIVNGIPGMLSGQGAFIVANGAKYLLMLFPEPGLVMDLDADILRGWNTIVNSLTFFLPEMPLTVVHPQDICPVETEYGKPYINEAEGYCYLYPSDFVHDPQFGDRFVGGPVLTYDMAFGGDIRETISVSQGGYEPGKTPRQTIEHRLQFIPADSITDMIISGYPAVAFLDTNGAWISRQAHISVNGQIYSILIQPYEPTLFTDGILYANKAWDVVTTSIQFLDPWH